MLLGQLLQAAERFARLVESLSEEDLRRSAHHGEYGAVTLSQCVTLPVESVADHLRQAQAAALR